jgi:hypothetical protein
MVPIAALALDQVAEQRIDIEILILQRCLSQLTTESWHD